MSGESVSFRDQVTFQGTSNCNEFRPNKFKVAICTNCSTNLLAHSSEAVRDDAQIKAALEYIQTGTPSLIFEEYHRGGGGLWLGGFKSSINLNHLTDNNIGLIVNTAAGLELFGPKFISGKEKVKNTGIEFLELGLVDDFKQELDYKMLEETIKKMEITMREEKTSVLVHCAQGKSRSTSIVVAFLMATHASELTFDQALEIVKERRTMAEPNRNFKAQLKKWGVSAEFTALRRELA